MKKIAVFVLAAALCLAAVSGFAGTFVDAHGNTVELDESLEAYTDYSLLGGDAVRAGETNLGDLWADALHWFADSGKINEAFEEDDVKAGITSLDVDAAHIVALWNAGNLKTDIEPGVFNAEKIAEVLPYPNKVAVVYMTGSQLLEQLEACSQGIPCGAESKDACAAFMQVSGLSYTVNTKETYDAGEAYGDFWFKANSVRRVSIEFVNGEPFDKDALYAVITSNANFNGMDVSYVMKEAAEAVEHSTITTAVVRDVVWMYLSEVLGNHVDAAYEQPAGRITIE
ncbi:MAG: 5'-nucleotidase C-terminal domain-containing protein [Clostridia bacterium]|nr:5'-nucleotidase C-terminal domain-containing protein [Clostridia bacterium]